MPFEVSKFSAHTQLIPLTLNLVDFSEWQILLAMPQYQEALLSPNTSV
jgi:hypothetical protein